MAPSSPARITFFFIDEFEMNHALADGSCHCGAKNESSDEVPEGCPQDCAKRCEHAGGHNRGNRIRGIVPAVGKFEGKGDKNRDDD